MEQLNSLIGAKSSGAYQPPRFLQEISQNRALSLLSKTELCVSWNLIKYLKKGITSCQSSIYFVWLFLDDKLNFIRLDFWIILIVYHLLTYFPQPSNSATYGLFKVFKENAWPRIYLNSHDDGYNGNDWTNRNLIDTNKFVVFMIKAKILNTPLAPSWLQYYTFYERKYPGHYFLQDSRCPTTIRNSQLANPTHFLSFITYMNASSRFMNNGGA